jgi:hypothetical protein
MEEQTAKIPTSRTLIVSQETHKYLSLFKVNHELWSIDEVIKKLIKSYEKHEKKNGKK